MRVPCVCVHCTMCRFISLSIYSIIKTRHTRTHVNFDAPSHWSIEIENWNLSHVVVLLSFFFERTKKLSPVKKATDLTCKNVAYSRCVWSIFGPKRHTKTCCLYIKEETPRNVLNNKNKDRKEDSIRLIKQREKKHELHFVREMLRCINNYTI